MNTFVYLLLRALAWLVARLPFSRLAGPGAALGVLAGGVLRIRRAHVTAAMARAGVQSPASAARAMYRSLGTSLFELLWLAGRGAHHARELAHVDEDSRAALDRARAAGRGLVIAASHTGNWDLAACAMAADAPLLVVTKRLKMRGVDAFWQETRARAGVSLVEAAGALTAGRAALRRGGAVAMMIDQVPLSARHATRADYLGAVAWVDRAPATLAAQTGAPLVVSAARRDARGRHVLAVLAVLEPPSRAGATGPGAREAWITRATCEATAALAAFVRAYPSEWLWMHRRWRAPALAGTARREIAPVGDVLSPARGLARTSACTIPSSSPVEASRAASS